MIRLELVILALVLIPLIAALWFGIWHGRKYKEYGMWSSLGGALAVASSIGGAIIAIALVVCLIPFQPHYWFYEEHAGQIESISNRFLDASGDLSAGTYVLSVGGESLVVEDPRVLNYAVGDDIALNCLPIWVYGAADRIYCNIL